MLALFPVRGYITHMGKLTGTETLGNGLSVEDLSDLTGIDAPVLAAKWDSPREFTLAEVAALAPRLGLTVHEFVGEVLA